MSKKYFYNERKGSQKGPFTIEEIHLLAARGTLKPKSLIFDSQGEAYDTDEVVDFQALKTAANVGNESSWSAFSFWIPLIIRLIVTATMLLISYYWLRQSNNISTDASEISHFQLSAQYSLIAVVALGFAIVTWFISKPEHSVL